MTDKKSNNSASFEDAQDGEDQFEDASPNNDQDQEQIQIEQKITVTSNQENEQNKSQQSYKSSSDYDKTESYQMDKPNEEDLKNNPCMLSTTISVGDKSFIDYRQPYKRLAPPPKYFDNEFLLTQFMLPNVKNVILNDFDFPDCGGLVFTDEEQLNKQKGILSHVIKQLAVNMMKGLSMSHTSLPIRIFEPRSTIQRICDLFSFAHKYLEEAAMSEDHLERLKLTITFMISSIYMCCDQNKPFNPLLGETLQAKFPDGTKIFCEHTSHHPPITNFCLEHKDGLYTLNGYFEQCGKMGANSFTSGLRGPCFLTFKDGHNIRFGFPSYKVGGMVMGERTIETIGSTTFEDMTNQRKAVLLMSSYKKTGWIRSTYSGNKDEIQGIIYDTHDIPTDYESIKKTYCKEIQFVEDLNKLKDVKSQVSTIQGSWLKTLEIDGKLYWNINDDIPGRQIPLLDTDNQGIILPSDWRYREDLIWLKYGYELIAHQWKMRLEVQQRFDRANRNEADKRNGRSKKH